MYIEGPGSIVKGISFISQIPGTVAEIKCVPASVHGINKNPSDFPFRIEIFSVSKYHAFLGRERNARELNQDRIFPSLSTTLIVIRTGSDQTTGVLTRERISLAEFKTESPHSIDTTPSEVIRTFISPGSSEPNNNGILDSVASICIFVSFCHAVSIIYPPETSISRLWRLGEVGFQDASFRLIKARVLEPFSSCDEIGSKVIFESGHDTTESVLSPILPQASETMNLYTQTVCKNFLGRVSPLEVRRIPLQRRFEEISSYISRLRGYFGEPIAHEEFCIVHERRTGRFFVTSSEYIGVSACMN